MAIDALQFKMIVQAQCKGRALSAGYPDLLVSRAQIEAAIGAGDGQIRERYDSQKVADHHSYTGRIYDSHDVFAAMGLQLEVIDRAVYQGCERVVDLNVPWNWSDDSSEATPDIGLFDLVIDPGTSEHCFNVAQALVNLARAVKVGGCISQALPVSMFNHGYWNVNPVALLDFYQANGFKIERLLIRSGTEIFEPALTEMGRRMAGVPENAAVLVLARRLEKRDFEWPQQKLPV